MPDTSGESGRVTSKLTPFKAHLGLNRTFKELNPLEIAQKRRKRAVLFGAAGVPCVLAVHRPWAFGGAFTAGGNGINFPIP